VYDVESLIIIVVITLNIIAVTEHRSLIESVLPLKLTFTMQLFENNPKHVQPLKQEIKKLLLLSGATQMNSSLNTPTVFYNSDN
jgi:hypothetical protein